MSVRDQRLVGRQRKLQYRSIKPRVTPDEGGLIRQRAIFSPPFENSTHDMERVTPMTAIHASEARVWPGVHLGRGLAAGSLHGACLRCLIGLDGTDDLQPQKSSPEYPPPASHWGIIHEPERSVAGRVGSRPHSVGAMATPVAGDELPGAGKPNLRVKLGGS